MDNKIKVLIDIDKTLFESVVDHTRNGYIGSDVWIAVANGRPYNDSRDFISISAAEIDSAKTIARLQAEWVCKTKSTFPQYQPDEFECSSCKQVSTQKYNFCPYCGAGMRGDKND